MYVSIYVQKNVKNIVKTVFLNSPFEQILYQAVNSINELTLTIKSLLDFMIWFWNI